MDIYTDTPEMFRTLELVGSERELLCAQQAAAAVVGVTVELLPATSIEEKELAVLAYSQVCEDMNQQAPDPADRLPTERYAPGWRSVARRIIEDGGSIIQITADKTSGKTKPKFAAYRNKLKTLTSQAILAES